MLNIVLFGPPGAGKGTQSEKLIEKYKLVHLSTGDILRSEIAAGTELGMKAKKLMDAGMLVPDEVVIGMIDSKLDTNKNAIGFIFDGFPRTIAQAQALDNGLQQSGQHVACAVYLKVPREVLLRRLSGRYICRAHQHVYNISTNPPKVAGICDIDGSELYQRSDDQGAAIQRRLDIFFHETIRVVDYYRSQQKLLEVDGNQGIEQVQTNLIAVIKQFVSTS